MDNCKNESGFDCKLERYYVNRNEGKGKTTMKQKNKLL